MHSELMIGLTGVLLIGILAQWLAWRVRVPSILLLLLFGIIAGPVSNFIDPDELIGEALGTFVSMAVGLILFEGGLSLRLRELPGVRTVIFSLISLGMLATWAIGTWAAHSLLGLEWSMATLLGAILTVTGPTVIIPLLRDIRAKPTLSSVLKWEGILIDPVGAVVAVLVFETIHLGEFSNAPTFIAMGVFKTLFFGGAVGICGAMLLILLIRRYLMPDYLQNPISLVLVLTVFTISNELQAESGLLATTLMGIVLANWSTISVRHIVEFKENLQVLLIGMLFILLSARLKPEQLEVVNLNSLIFLGVMVLVARPIAVFVSTIGTDLSWRDRALLSWVAPRGIVAAAVASLFSIDLAREGHLGAEQLSSYTFLIIIGTCFIYGLTSAPVARLLRVVQGSPQGVLFLGAHLIAREIAAKLKAEGFKVLLVDTNWTNVSVSRLEGLPTHYGNILSEQILDDLDLDGIGRLFALTPNDEANSLAALRFAEVFGRAGVFQLPPDSSRDGGPAKVHPKHLRGRFLFGPEQYYYLLEEQMSEGAIIKTINISEEFGYEKILEHYGELFVPLILVLEEESFEVVAHDQPFRPHPGQKVIALVKDPENEE